MKTNKKQLEHNNGHSFEQVRISIKLKVNLEMT